MTNKLLFDQEIDAIMSAAWPLPPAARAAFEQQCIAKLREVPPEQRGEGVVYRVVARAQREYLRSSTSPLVLGSNHSNYAKPHALRDKGK